MLVDVRYVCTAVYQEANHVPSATGLERCSEQWRITIQVFGIDLRPCVQENASHRNMISMSSEVQRSPARSISYLHIRSRSNQLLNYTNVAIYRRVVKRRASVAISHVDDIGLARDHSC